MEFWGVEVKSGEPLVVEPGDEKVLHLSQACLGEVKKEKGSEPICLYVNTGKQKLAIGILSFEKFPQIAFDLVFEKRFELSHDWKDGSVYFCGYKATVNESDHGDYDSESDSDSGEDLPLSAPGNVTKVESEKAEAKKSDSGVPKRKVKIVEPNKDVKDNEMDDDSFDSETSEEESSDSETSDEDEITRKADDKMNEEDDDDESDEEDNEDETDNETEKKAAPGKKRANDSATKTPVPEKKAKVKTPQKTEVKKGSGHVATPYPSKQVGKTLANSDKSKEQISKAGKSGEFPCSSCNRSFGSDMALQSHTKAKHSAN